MAASVSDRVDGQTDALDRMAKALAETRTAAFAARKQTDPRAYADQVAGLVEDRLGRTLAVLHQNAARLEHEANRVQRLTDQTRELRGDAVALKQREAHDAAEWRAGRRRLLLWTAPFLLVLLLLTAVLVPRAMAASETLCTLAGAEWSPGGEYLSPSCRFDAWW